MKTIKIIDLLNKIANGDTPQKIRHWGTTYIFDEYRGDWGYVDKSTQPYKWFFKEFNCDLETDLNFEVEIIEEEKEIEKLDVALLGQCDNWLQHQETEEHSCLELNPYIIDNVRENTLYFQRKINELIDTINELKRGN